MLTLDQFIAAVVEAMAEAFLGFVAQRLDAPTVVKEIGHDPAEDQFDQDLSAAADAGLVAGVDG